MCRNILRKIMLGILVLAIALSGIGCKKKEDAPKVEEKVEEKKEKKVGELSNRKLDNLDFSINLLRNTYTFRQNSIVAPMSAQMALGVLLNGAGGMTQGCIIKTMGLETIKYNEYIKTYLDTLDEDDKDSLIYANSAWFNSITGNLEVNSNFENRIKEYLYTDVQMLIFNQYTKENLNDWINKRTNGFIDTLFLNTNSMDVMYMVNAAAFNMDWEKTYGASDIKQGAFVNINKTIASVEMMTSKEKYYIEDNNATGFVKEYSNPRYKFIALLPDKTTNVYSYIKGMSANSLNKVLSSIKEENVTVTMPKFTVEQTLNLRNAYVKMGMSNLFAEHAEFTGFMKNGNNIYLSKLFHKAKIEVGKTATQGSGVSTVNSVSDAREVIMNRPFVYMIYDSYHCLPIFMGVQQLM